MIFKTKFYFKSVCMLIVFSVLFSGFGNDLLRSKSAIASDAMVALSAEYSMPFIRGVRFDESDPFNLEFVVDRGTEKKITNSQRQKLVRYFLAALTVSEEKMWVNLSPYESDRIIENTVATTEIGQTLLQQDYLLKQLSSSLTHPDTELGKKYWAQSSVAKDSFSKIWITPGEISIYDENNLMMIVDADLDVQTEADYLASQNSLGSRENLESDLVKDLLVPALKKDVNNGRNFAELRSMFYSVLLAQWFKRKFSDSLYKFYFDAEKTAGVDVAPAELKKAIFERYVKAFKKGAYDVTRKTYDNTLSAKVKKRYFSGGAAPQFGKAVKTTVTSSTLTKKVADSTLEIIQGKIGTVSSAVEIVVFKQLQATFFENRDMEHKLKNKIRDAIWATPRFTKKQKQRLTYEMFERLDEIVNLFPELEKTVAQLKVYVALLPARDKKSQTRRTIKKMQGISVDAAKKLKLEYPVLLRKYNVGFSEEEVVKKGKVYKELLKKVQVENYDTTSQERGQLVSIVMELEELGKRNMVKDEFVPFGKAGKKMGDKAFKASKQKPVKTGNKKYLALAGAVVLALGVPLGVQFSGLAEVPVLKDLIGASAQAETPPANFADLTYQEKFEYVENDLFNEFWSRIDFSKKEALMAQIKDQTTPTPTKEEVLAIAKKDAKLKEDLLRIIKQEQTSVVQSEIEVKYIIEILRMKYLVKTGEKYRAAYVIGVGESFVNRSEVVNLRGMRSDKEEYLRYIFSQKSEQEGWSGSKFKSEFRKAAKEIGILDASANSALETVDASSAISDIASMPQSQTQQTNGGINIKGSFKNVKVQQSTSKIDLPNEFKTAQGLEFIFTTTPKITPITQILNK